MKTAVALVLGLALGIAIGACRFEQYRPPHLTGTCAGACDHYLGCKRNSDPAARTACISECGDVFQDEESLRAFESLECRDTIEYVEGESGRGPGTMVGGTKPE
jgi:hypothetical protein